VLRGRVRWLIGWLAVDVVPVTKESGLHSIINQIVTLGVSLWSLRCAIWLVGKSARTLQTTAGSKLCTLFLVLLLVGLAAQAGFLLRNTQPHVAIKHKKSLLLWIAPTNLAHSPPNSFHRPLCCAVP